MLVAATSLTPAEVEKDGVRVRVSIQAHVYTWEVTNLGVPPITSFELEPYHCYDYQAPDGWTVEKSKERFRAWTVNADSAIRPRQSKTFSARVSSQGAVLGNVPLSLGFEPDSAEPLTFEAVWGPVHKPRSMVALVAATLIVLAAVHALILWRRSPRAFPPAATPREGPPSSGSDR